MTAKPNLLATRARELALKLASWPSVTGTADEAYFAERLVNELDGFDRAWREPLPGDPYDRANVFALKRGKGRKAIVLTGHFDVVPVEDYGALKPLAFSPEALLPEIIAELKKNGDHPKALADFESGDFLPGRGLLDMKAGLAAGLAATAMYNGEGSVLFLGVCDEEDRSAGMRAASPLISQIAGEEKLDIRLIINLDAISDQDDGQKGRVAALGSIGKQLLTAFVIGKEAHACYPEDGVNAAYLAAELVSAFEMAPDLGETTGEEKAAPPTALYAKDLKQGYNVTTPAQAWAYWNTLQHRRSAPEVMEIALRLAKQAMARAAARTGRAIPVLRYEEIAARVAPEAIAAKAGELAQQNHLDLPERSKLLTAHVWQLSGLTGPAVVLGFGSIPYPAVSMADDGLEALVARTIAPFGLTTLGYFPGISDMSFLGLAPGTGDNADTPLAGSSFPMPVPAGYPVINIGPWGRDYHHWLERLHAPYAFETLPAVLLALIAEVLKSD